MHPGLYKRDRINPGAVIDIILAENIHGASRLAVEELGKHLPPGFPLDSIAGLVETSIGKMVPIIPIEFANKDPLLVLAEEYNDLIDTNSDSKAAYRIFPTFIRLTISGPMLRGNFLFINLGDAGGCIQILCY